MAILDIDGQPYGVLEQEVQYSDLPTDINKAYLGTVLDTAPKLAESFDQSQVSRSEIPNQDEPGTRTTGWLIPAVILTVAAIIIMRFAK